MLSQNSKACWLERGNLRPTLVISICGKGILTSLLSSHRRHVLSPKLRRINQLLCQTVLLRPGHICASHLQIVQHAYLTCVGLNLSGHCTILHRRHLEAVDRVNAINAAIQRVILAISERALVRESVEQADETHDNMAKKADCARTLSRPDAEWVQPFLESSTAAGAAKVWARSTALVGALALRGLATGNIRGCTFDVDIVVSTIRFAQGIMGLILMVSGKILQSEWCSNRGRSNFDNGVLGSSSLLNRCSFLTKTAVHNKWRDRTQWFSLFIRHQFGSRGRTNDYLQSNNQWAMARLPRAVTRDGKLLDLLPVGYWAS